jgi:hypothetical protein
MMFLVQRNVVSFTSNTYTPSYRVVSLQRLATHTDCPISFHFQYAHAGSYICNQVQDCRRVIVNVKRQLELPAILIVA